MLHTYHASVPAIAFAASGCRPDQQRRLGIQAVCRDIREVLVTLQSDRSHILSEQACHLLRRGVEDMLLHRRDIITGGTTVLHRREPS